MSDEKVKSAEEPASCSWCGMAPGWCFNCGAPLRYVFTCEGRDRHRHGECPKTAPTPHWRTGRTLGRTLYLDDRLVGMLDTEELARAVVERMNGVEPAPPAAGEPKIIGRLRELPERLNDRVISFRIDGPHVTCELGTVVELRGLVLWIDRLRSELESATQRIAEQTAHAAAKAELEALTERVCEAGGGSHTVDDALTWFEIQGKTRARYREAFLSICADVLRLPVPPGKDPDAWCREQVERMSRNFDGEIAEHARHHEVEDGLRAELAAEREKGAKASRNFDAESRACARVALRELAEYFLAMDRSENNAELKSAWDHAREMCEASIEDLARSSPPAVPVVAEQPEPLRCTCVGPAGGPHEPGCAALEWLNRQAAVPAVAETAEKPPPQHTCVLASGCVQPTTGCPACNDWMARDPTGFAMAWAALSAGAVAKKAPPPASEPVARLPREELSALLRVTRAYHSTQPVSLYAETVRLLVAAAERDIERSEKDPPPAKDEEQESNAAGLTRHLNIALSNIGKFRKECAPNEDTPLTMAIGHLWYAIKSIERSGVVR